MSDGWAVEVQTKLLGGIGHSKEIFYARFASQPAAEKAVRNYINATADVIVRGIRPVAGKDFEAMNVDSGMIDQVDGSVDVTHPKRPARQIIYRHCDGWEARSRPLDCTGLPNLMKLRANLLC
jgi:hypothetical protein